MDTKQPPNQTLHFETPTFSQGPFNHWRLVLILLSSFIDANHGNSVHFPSDDYKKGRSLITDGRSEHSVPSNLIKTTQSTTSQLIRGHYGSSGQEFLISFLAGFFLFLSMMALVTFITRCYFRTNYNTLLGFDDEEDETDNESADEDAAERAYETVFGKGCDQSSDKFEHSKLISVQTNKYDSMGRQDNDEGQKYEFQLASPLIASPRTVIASVHDRPSKSIVASPSASPNCPSASSSLLLHNDRLVMYQRPSERLFKCERPSSCERPISSERLLIERVVCKRPLTSAKYEYCEQETTNQEPLIKDFCAIDAKLGTTDAKLGTTDAKVGVGKKTSVSAFDSVQNNENQGSCHYFLREQERGTHSLASGANVASDLASDRRNKKSVTFKTLQVSLKSSKDIGVGANKTTYL